MVVIVCCVDLWPFRMYFEWLGIAIYDDVKSCSKLSNGSLPTCRVTVT